MTVFQVIVELQFIPVLLFPATGRRCPAATINTFGRMDETI
jgi:hypothetical protein